SSAGVHRYSYSGLPVSRHVTHGAMDHHEKQGHTSRCRSGSHAGVLCGRASRPGAPQVTLPGPPRPGLLAYVLLITDTEEIGCRTALHVLRSTTDGFSSTYTVPGPGHTEHRHRMFSDSAASNGASPRDLASCSALSSRSASPDASSRR